MRYTATLLAVTAMAGTTTLAHAETWDMPMAYPASNYHTENGELFAQCVADATENSLEIITHANGSLFAGNDIKRAVQTGQAPIGERLISAHANENPLFGIDSVPFLATSFEDSDRLWAVAEDTINSVLEDQNLVYIYSVPWPPQGLYVNKEVDSVEDLSGIKFRAYNAATSRIAELAGMVPVQIEAAELSHALATGVADAFISSGSTGVDSKVWESLTHFYDVRAWLPRNVVFANKDAFEALDADTQQAILDCGAEAGAEGTAKAAELTAGYLKTLAENGMEVGDPSDQLREEFAGFGETMTEEWIEAAGEDGQAIIEAYRAE